MGLLIPSPVLYMRFRLATNVIIDLNYTVASWHFSPLVENKSSFFVLFSCRSIIGLLPLSFFLIY